MSEVLFCVDCKHFEPAAVASCTREIPFRDLVYGIYPGAKYSCAEERGYDLEYITRSLLLNHEICGVAAKFFEVK